jgi:hypothetical protein
VFTWSHPQHTTADHEQVRKSLRVKCVDVLTLETCVRFEKKCMSLAPLLFRQKDYSGCSERPAAALLCAHLGSVTPGLPGSWSSGGISGRKFCITLNSTCVNMAHAQQARQQGQR